MAMLVGYTFENGIVEIRLNRAAKRNALSSDLLSELSSAIKKASDQQGNRLTVFSAEGSVFCAGMDLKEMQQRAALPDGEQLLLEDSKRYRDLLVAILNLPMPTLATVQGPVFAGGVGIVLACDLVIGAEECLIGLPEPKRGIVAAMVTPLLVRRVGVAAASHILLSGESIDAETALRLNLLQKLTTQENLNSTIREYTKSILTGAPDALAATKKQMLRCSELDLIAQLDEAIEVSAGARNSSEAEEGLNAFFEKRNPKWQLD